MPVNICACDGRVQLDPEMAWLKTVPRSASRVMCGAVSASRNVRKSDRVMSSEMNRTFGCFGTDGRAPSPASAAMATVAASRKEIASPPRLSHVRKTAAAAAARAVLFLLVSNLRGMARSLSRRPVYPSALGVSPPSGRR